MKIVDVFDLYTPFTPSAILNMNFVILDHPRSQLCGSISMSKFGIDPIFPAGDYYDFIILPLWLENA